MVNSPPKPDSGRKLFFGLFIFPLLIALGMAVLLCSVVLLTRESETPESLITAIKTGAPSKRWQKAFELSNELNQGRGMIRSAGVMKEIIHVLRDRDEYDARTRSYMAIALSRFHDPAAVLALKESLQSDPDPDVQLYVIWALGLQQAPGSDEWILPYLKHENAALRKTAAYVLGSLGTGGAGQKELEILLEDEERDVRWNAAISLARLGNDAGAGEIIKLTDRRMLEETEGLDEARVEEIMISAVKALGLLGKEEFRDLLGELSRTEKSLKVRQAAMDALEQIQNQDQAA